MRELNVNEIEQVNGGISGYEGAGSIIAVVGFGALFTPIGAITGGIAIGAVAGLAIAQFVADNLSGGVGGVPRGGATPLVSKKK